MPAGPNPLINLGKLNRLRGTVLIPLYPQLNITAPSLGRDGIKLALEGNTTDMLPQMVAQVQSQNVYMPAMITIALVKTTPLANLFKRQWELDSNIGDITFRSDASQLDPYEFSNCAIERAPGLDASGTSALLEIVISGTYYINSNLFNL